MSVINISVKKKTIKAASKAINKILMDVYHDKDVLTAALISLTKMCSVDHTTISNNSFRSA